MKDNLRTQFFEETTIAYVHNNREPYSSYVEWLENIIVGQKNKRKIDKIKLAELIHSMTTNFLTEKITDELYYNNLKMFLKNI